MPLTFHLESSTEAGVGPGALFYASQLVLSISQSHIKIFSYSYPNRKPMTLADELTINWGLTHYA